MRKNDVAKIKTGRPGMLKGEALFAFNKARYGDTIRKYRLRNGMNQSQLAALVGVTKNAVPHWETGRTRPDTNFIPAICEAFGISISTFFGIPGSPNDLTFDEQRHMGNYRILSELNRRTIDHLIDAMIENEDAALRERCETGFEHKRRSGLKASAGIGFSLSDDDECEYVYVRISREACRADEIITVSGDSMEPTILDGDDLFIEYTKELNPGEIGVFVAGGEGYVKEYRKDGLYSHNRKYPVLRFNEDDDARCIGRVLGIVEKNQYATDLELEIIEDIKREKAGKKG